MLKRLSKLFLLVFVLLFTFTISGCTNNQGDGQEYSIIYINGTTVVDLEPRTYISGEVTKLPSLGEDFTGWYTNKELDGAPVNEIKANSTGNLIFYTNYNLEKEVFYFVVFKDYDNKVLKEESVKENESATAPSAPTREGYEFIGWSEDFSNVTNDLTVVALYKEVGKDIVLYFKNVFENCGNFKLEYKCTDNEEYNSNETYLYAKNGVAYAYQDWYDNLYVDYYYKDVNGLMVYLVDNGDGTYEKFVEGSEVFDIVHEYFYTIKYTEISNEDFTYSDNCYTAKEEKVNELAKLLIGAYPDETFSSLKVYVEGDYINKIVASSEIVYDGEKYPYDYEITFSDFNNVSVSLPDESKVKEALSISTQSNTYTVSKGTNFDDVLTDVIITLTYNNGTTEV